MDVQTLRTLVEYTQHANHKVWACIDALDEEKFLQEHDYSIGGIHDQAFHMMKSDWYVLRMEGALEDGEEMPDIADYTDWATIKSAWQNIDARITACVDALTDEALNEVIETPVRKELRLHTPRWEMWMSYVNHNTNHRAQVLAFLHQLGGETTEQGYFFYLVDRETAKQTA